jgi:hypothetical protein
LRITEPMFTLIFFKHHSNDDIFFHFQLSPTDKNIISDWETEVSEAKEFVRKLNVISTNKDKDAPETEPEKEVIIVSEQKP